MLKEFLKRNGVHVQRFHLRDAIDRVNHSRVNSRKKGRLKRRIYNVKGPNHLWHIDTNHKLIRWNFIIFSSVDGFSHFPVILQCLDNNKAETILSLLY